MRPMRGRALNLLTSAFRLRQAVLAGNNAVPEGTAKHGLNDQRDIGRERHVHLLRTAVDELFSAEYLIARGLDRKEATKHNDLVTQALDVILVRWDQVAIFTNIAPEHSEPVDDLLGFATGFSVELPLRLAAYEALYGHLHPFLEEVQQWLKGPKLKPWWRSVENRARRPIKVSLLHERGELDSRTVRAFRDGKALPNEGTLPLLARRLAEHSVRDRQEERDAQAAELAFELRVAVAAADRRDIVERLLTPRSGDLLIMQLHVLRHVLRGAPDVVAEDLLRRGTQARSWPLVEALFRAALMAQVVEGALQMKADADRKMADIEENPKKGFRELAKFDAEQAAHLSNIDPRPGADGPEKRMVEYHEYSRNVWLAAADGTLNTIREPRPEWLAELRADSLCDEAIAPWLKLSIEEQEKRFREAVRVCDGSAYAHRSLGQHLSHVGTIDEAILHLRRSVELNPENEEGRESLAMIQGERGDYQDVLTLTAGKISSTILRAVRAYALVKTGDVVGAEELARAILNEYPRHTVALRVLAECFRASGDDRRARELEAKADFLERGVRPPGG